MILSFGLLGPGKGYESAIAAMPAVVKAIPSAVYVILGATHPDLLEREGEAYRERLVAAAADAGVTDSVRFIDRFVGRVELGTWLEAADLFVTPYPNMDQIVSGTLSYAMGSGKAVVSTPYAYAKERLAGGPGSPRGSRVLGGACRRVHRPAREPPAATGDRQARLRVQPGHGVVERGRRVQPDLRAGGAVRSADRSPARPADLAAGRAARGRRWVDARSIPSTGSTLPR